MHELKSGGAEKLCADILKKFDYERFDVTLLLIQNEGIYLNDIPKNVNIVSLFNPNQKLPSFCNSRYLRNIIRKLLLWYKLPKNVNYDTIISFMEGASLRYHSLITKRALRNISWVHIDLKENHWSKKYFWDEKEENQAYKSMDSVVFVSEAAKKAFHELYPDVENLDVILNLIDTDEIRNKANMEEVHRPDGYLICGVGRLVEQKRFDRFIEVIRELQERGYPIHGWIIGDGYEKEFLRKNINNSEVNNVSLLGFKKNPLPYVNAADLFLSTADNEGFSLVVAEAMALGKPIVSTSVTGPSELLADNAGLLTGFDVSEIADAIELLLRTPEMARQYAQSALKRSQMFNVEATMKRIYTAIDPKL